MLLLYSVYLAVYVLVLSCGAIVWCVQQQETKSYVVRIKMGFMQVSLQLQAGYRKMVGTSYNIRQNVASGVSYKPPLSFQVILVNPGKFLSCGTERCVSV